MQNGVFRWSTTSMMVPGDYLSQSMLQLIDCFSSCFRFEKVTEPAFRLRAQNSEPALIEATLTKMLLEIPPLTGNADTFAGVRFSF